LLLRTDMVTLNLVLIEKVFHFWKICFQISVLADVEFGDPRGGNKQATSKAVLSTTTAKKANFSRCNRQIQRFLAGARVKLRCPDSLQTALWGVLERPKDRKAFGTKYFWTLLEIFLGRNIFGGALKSRLY
jgi:hypothetical protein